MNGEWIRDWRLGRGMTQEQLATLLFVAPNTVARWERGELEVSGWLVVAIIGLTVTQTMRQQSEKPNEKRTRDSPGQSSHRRRSRRPRSEWQRKREAAEALREAATMVAIDDARRRQLLQLCHPDRHGNSKVATEVTAWLNQMRPTRGGGAPT